MHNLTNFRGKVHNSFASSLVVYFKNIKYKTQYYLMYIFIFIDVVDYYFCDWYKCAFNVYCTNILMYYVFDYMF